MHTQKADKAQPSHSNQKKSNSLHHELATLHTRVTEQVPDLDRIAVVIYDHKTDLLRTYSESSQSLDLFSHHEFPLSQCIALRQCADNSESRIINNIPKQYSSDSIHSKWLIEHGYRSSYTIPIYHLQHFIGFVFFNSYKQDLFTNSVQQTLHPFVDLISFVVNAEYSLLHAIVASADLTKALSDGYNNASKNHMERISGYSKLIAKDIALIYKLDDEMIESIHLFSRLHDIGKAVISTDILLKPDSLVDDEKEEMKQHIADGITMVDNIIENLGYPTHPSINTLKDIIAYHQEFLDGSGYPNGLSHDDIPVSARIVTVANIFDALTSHRPYKQACSIASAMLELEKMVHTGKLDRHCVSALRDHQESLLNIIKLYPETDPSSNK